MRWDYDRKFGKFHYNVTDLNWFDEKKEAIEEIHEVKTVEPYRKHKDRIYAKWDDVFKKFVKYTKQLPMNIDEGKDEAVTWYHTQCLQDYELFSLNYMLADNGLPIFPLEWQSETSYAIEYNDFRKVFALQTRKNGKTLWAQTFLPYKMANPFRRREQVRIFAPTEKQLFVVNDIHDSIQQSEFLMEEFVMLHNPDRKHEGKFNTESIRFGKNWSDLSGTNLGLNQAGGKKGKTKVGEKGSLFFIDEWGLVPEEVMRAVIKPMGADAFSRKVFIGFGTPTLDVNPNLEETWIGYLTDPKIKTLRYDWMYGVTNGSITAEYMRDEAFKEYRIPCPFGLFHGICGKQLYGNKVRINEETGELIKKGDDDYALAWSCDDCCMLNKSFVEEYTASFCKMSQEFWDMSLIELSGNPNLRFHTKPTNPNGQYICSVDFGLMMYPTQMGIFEVKGNKIRLEAYKEIIPLRERHKAGTVHPKYDPIVFALHEFTEPYDNQIVKYYFDVTNNDRLSELLVDGVSSGVKEFRGYPRNKIFRNETAKSRGTYGIHNSGTYNYKMKTNTNAKFAQRAIEVPMKKPFWDNYIWEFKNCVVQETGQDYLKFDHPKTGRKRIDILDMITQAAVHLEGSRGCGANTRIVAVQQKDKGRRGRKRNVCSIR